MRQNIYRAMKTWNIGPDLESSKHYYSVLQDCVLYPDPNEPLDSRISDAMSVYLMDVALYSVSYCVHGAPR